MNAVNQRISATLGWTLNYKVKQSIVKLLFDIRNVIDFAISQVSVKINVLK